MARSTMETTNPLRKEAWEERLFRDTSINTFFMSRFAGNAMQNLDKGFDEGRINTSPNDVMHIITDLGAKGKTKTRKGDKTTFGLVPRIDPKVNSGVTSGQTLKGKEVPLVDYDFSLELERYRQAVSTGGPMDWNRSSYNMPDTGRSMLLSWGSDKMELLTFQALEASPTNIFYNDGGTIKKTSTLATAKAALTLANSKLTPAFVSYMKTWAKTGGARAGGQIPLRPIKVGGKQYLILITHTDALFDWKNDSEVQQAAREAEVRSSENPIFTGASYIHDNVIIYDHEYVSVAEDGGGAAVPWTYAHMLGAQSICVAFGEKGSLVDDSEDYEEDFFVAWRMTMKVEKPVFNSLDYGSITSTVARTNVSGS